MRLYSKNSLCTPIIGNFAAQKVFDRPPPTKKQESTRAKSPSDGDLRKISPFGRNDNFSYLCALASLREILVGSSPLVIPKGCSVLRDLSLTEEGNENVTRAAFAFDTPEFGYLDVVPTGLSETGLGSDRFG
jgi:hypothetical protein